MRILMLNYEFPPIGGGGGIGNFKLAKGLVKLGCNIDVVTTKYKSLKKFEKLGNIKIFRLNCFRKNKNTANLLSIVIYTIKGFFLSKQLLQKNKYDLIFSYFVVPSGFLGYLLSKNFNVKHFVNIIGGDIYDPTKSSSPHRFLFLRKLIKTILQSSKYVFSISSDTTKRAKQYYDLDERKTLTIPIPFDKPKFKLKSRAELGLKKDIKYIISIGRLVKRKGFDYLIKSLADLNVELLLIGKGPEEESLKKFASESNVKVNFLGEKWGDDKFNFLCNSDIYVLSSIHEGMGIVIQEAMSVGLPIIATNYGGQVDLIKPRNGVLIPHKNVNIMAEEIQKLLSDKKRMDYYSKNNVQDIKQYSVDSISKKYFEIFEKKS